MQVEEGDGGPVREGVAWDLGRADGGAGDGGRGGGVDGGRGVVDGGRGGVDGRRSWKGGGFFVVEVDEWRLWSRGRWQGGDSSAVGEGDSGAMGAAAGD